MKNRLITDPRLAVQADSRPTMKRLVLGLDLGTTTGAVYSWYDPNEPVVAGMIKPEHFGNWDLSAGPYDSGAIRFVRLRHFLTAVMPDLVVYEDVKFTPPAMHRGNVGAVLARTATSSEFLGALKATVATWCEENGVPCVGFGIGVIKKRATGRGNANKEQVITACNEFFGTDFDTDGYETTGVDNMADAGWVCLLGLEQYASGIAPVGPEE